MEHLQTDFLQSLVTEIEGVLGTGSVSLGNLPWVLDGKPHLQIVCNHRSVASLNEHGVSVVLAIWRACRFQQWRNLEWQPLVIEWPKLAVVHVLNGKALIRACVRLTTKVLCGTDENFKPQQHHLLALPVDAEQFASSGIPLIDNPLIERLFALLGAVIAFCFTVPRYLEMLEMCLKHDIQEADIEPMLLRYSKELTLVWQQAQTKFGLLLNALEACTFPQVCVWKEGLRGVCEKLLFTVNQDESLSLTHQDFEAWSTVFESELQKLHALVADLLSTLLSHATPGSNLATLDR